MSVNLSEQEFRELAVNYNVIPVFKEILSDVDTPLSVFQKIHSPDRFSFLFESVEQGESVGRYSFIGSSLPVYLKTKKNFAEFYNNGQVQCKNTNDPIGELKTLLDRFKPAKVENLPPFWGGFVGYVGYDVVHFYEPIPDLKPDTLKLPDLYFFLSDEVVAFDNVNKTIKIIVSAVIEEGDDAGEKYRETIGRIEKIEERLNREIKLPRIPVLNVQEVDIKQWKSNFSKEDFLKAVEKCKHYIREGDIIQVVISQRFSKKLKAEPINVYRAVRSINPSPYLFYL
ncbi:MAG: anthranilate synthase component I, partial [Aquificae bacterium]|nr:anthranilate synthase component I [Aquificota bacterium]